MIRYIFGTQTGEFPAHLVGGDDESNRIYAGAVLEGPTHTAFFGIEAPDEAGLEFQESRIRDEGVDVAMALSPCLRPPCMVSQPDGPTNPSHIPPYLRYLLMHIAYDGEPERMKSALTALHERFGSESVASMNDGAGMFFVEVGGGADIDAAPQMLSDALGVDVVVHSTDAILH